MSVAAKKVVYQPQPAPKKTSDVHLLYCKLIIFFGFFILTSFIVRQDSYTETKPKAWFRSSDTTVANHATRVLKQNFVLAYRLADVAKFIFRIILASFLKDAIFAVFSPDKLRAPVPQRLISMVEEETLDQSWIPVTELEWKERSRSGNIETEKTHSFIYNFGRATIGVVVLIGQSVQNYWMLAVAWVEFALSTVVSSLLGMIVFVFRSIVCTCSSIVLIGLYIIQLVLRTVKQFYNLILMGLTWVCTMINDLSLLSVELIQRTVVLENEEVFVTLRNSIRKTGTDLGVNRPE